jgi:hypothetical protein
VGTGRLGYLGPIEFEEKHYVNKAATEPVSLKPGEPALNG